MLIGVCVENKQVCEAVRWHYCNAYTATQVQKLCSGQVQWWLCNFSLYNWCISGVNEFLAYDKSWINLALA